MPLHNEIKLLPGDDLIIECQYSSLDRSTITFGGKTTQDEMCMAFVFVYPRPKLTVCYSAHADSDSISWLQHAYQNKYVSGDIEKAFATGKTQLITWHNNDGAEQWYNKHWSAESKYQMICNQKDGEMVDVGHLFAGNYDEYPQEDICSKKD
eukprot:137431_1